MREKERERGINLPFGVKVCETRFFKFIKNYYILGKDTIPRTITRTNNCCHAIKSNRMAR